MSTTTTTVKCMSARLANTLILKLFKKQSAKFVKDNDELTAVEKQMVELLVLYFEKQTQTNDLVLAEIAVSLSKDCTAPLAYCVQFMQKHQALLLSSIQRPHEMPAKVEQLMRADNFAEFRDGLAQLQALLAQLKRNVQQTELKPVRTIESVLMKMCSNVESQFANMATALAGGEATMTPAYMAELFGYLSAVASVAGTYQILVLLVNLKDNPAQLTQVDATLLPQIRSVIAQVEQVKQQQQLSSGKQETFENSK